MSLKTIVKTDFGPEVEMTAALGYLLVVVKLHRPKK